VLRADRRIARYLARDVFHLLGYHYLAREGEMLLFSRQPHDRRRPRSIVL